MINKRSQLAERILLIMYGGDLTKDRVHEIPDIELAIDSQFAYLMKQNYFTNISLDERNVDGQYVTTFKNIEATLDEERNEYYITKPATYVNLPRCAGIVRISPMKQLDDNGIPIEPFIYTPSGTSYQSLPCFYLDGRNGYYPEGDKIYFRKETKGKLMVKLLVAGITDINLTPDMEDPIISYVLKVYIPQQPSDKTNDTIKIS